jgi:hypothetical protein
MHEDRRRWSQLPARLRWVSNMTPLLGSAAVLSCGRRPGWLPAGQGPVDLGQQGKPHLAAGRLVKLVQEPAAAGRLAQGLVGSQARPGEKVFGLADGSQALTLPAGNPISSKPLREKPRDDDARGPPDKPS